MPIIPWKPFLSPFEEIKRVFSEFPMGRLRGFSPAIDVYEDKNNVYVETFLAGVKPEEIYITVENNILSVQGEMKKEKEVDEKNYYRKEMRTGSFFRSVALPAHVITGRAKAISKEGILKITLPKAPKGKPKTLKIMTDERV